MKKLLLSCCWLYAASLFAGNLEQWTKAQDDTLLNMENGIVFVSSSTPGKKGQIFFKKAVNAFDGLKIHLSGDFSGNGEVQLGCHYYDTGSRWLGMISGVKFTVADGQPKKIEETFVLPKKKIAFIRPFIDVLSGKTGVSDFKLTQLNVINADNINTAPVFRAWQYDRTSEAQKISMSGNGDAANSMLSIKTAPRQKCSLFAGKTLPVKENSRIKIRFRIAGKGKAFFGLHLYRQGNVWLGMVEEKASSESGEVNFIIKTPAGKPMVSHVRPFFRVQPDSNISIGEIEVMKMPESPEKAEVEIPLPDGFQLLTPGPNDFPVRFFASENRIILDEINTPFGPAGNQVDSITICAVDEKNQKRVAEKNFIFERGKVINQSIRLPETYRGDFYIAGEFLDKKQNVLITGRGYSTVPHMDLTTGRYMVANMLRNAHLKKWVQNYPMGMKTFRQQKFPFQSTNSMKHHFPFFPEPELTALTVNILERCYEYGTDGFLKQVIARQLEPTIGAEKEEILAEKLSLCCDGIPISMTATPLRKEGKSIFWEQTGHHAGADWKIINRLDPDGVQRMNIQVIPSAAFNPGKVTLSIPINDSQATLFQNVTDIAYRRKDQTKKLGSTLLGGHAGSTPQAKITGNTVWQSLGQERRSPGSFLPYLWLGNEDRGFCYFADDEQDWLVDDSRSALELKKKDGQVTLAVNFINRKKSPVPQKQLKWTIGLLATPVKTPLKHWRGTIFPRWMTMDKSFYSKLDNCRKIIMVSAGAPAFNAGTQSIVSPDIEKTQKMYKNIRDQFGSTYQEYFCSDELNPNIPELRTFFSEWAVMPANGLQDSKSIRRPSASYDVSSATVVYMQRFIPSYLAYRNWAIGRKIDQVGALSFYEDNIHLRRFFDPPRNKGFRDEQGRIHPSYDLWSLRDYYHSLASHYEKHQFDNLTGAHASASLLIPALTNCSFFIDGEQPGRYDSTDDKDYIDHWKDLDYMRAVSMGRAFGINTIFLSEMTFPGKDEDGHHSRAWLALLLPHDIAPWDGTNKNREPVKTWHKIINDLDFYHDSPRLYPYWAKGKHKVFEHAHEDLLVTVWKQKQRIVVMLSNLGEAGSFTVRLLPEKLGIKSIKSLADMENKKSISLHGNTFSMKIPRHDYRLLAAELKN